MGCDIHMHVEKREKGAWRFVAPKELGIPIYEDYGNEDGPNGFWEVEERWEEETGAAWEPRNPNLFALLANVRNWNERIPPLDDPRGVPPDASSEYRNEVEEWGVDGHSHSYFTIAELREALTDRPVRQWGFFSDTRWIPGGGVQLHSLHRIRTHIEQHGNPPDGVSYTTRPAPGVVYRLPSGESFYVPDTVPTPILSPEKMPTYELLEWFVPYRDLMPRFFYRLLDYIEEKIGLPPEDIRLLFFFDN